MLVLRAGYEVKREMTNGDRIRKMSNSELAEIIMCPYEIERGMCNDEMSCLECCDEWLAKESEPEFDK